MDLHLDAYDIAYSDIGQEMLSKVGHEVYGEYIGQLSWMTIEEYRRFIARLAPTEDSHVLEIGSGSGGGAEPPQPATPPPRRGRRGDSDRIWGDSLPHRV